MTTPMILTKMTLAPEEVQIGDRLDPAGRNRVAATHVRRTSRPRMIAKITRRGTRSATVTSWSLDEQATIYRPERRAAR